MGLLVRISVHICVAALNYSVKVSLATNYQSACVSTLVACNSLYQTNLQNYDWHSSSLFWIFN